MASLEPSRSASLIARPARGDIRGAWLVSVHSVTWTFITGCAAIAVGVNNASALLVAFGSVGFIDAVGSAALAYHFRHGLRHDELVDHLEHAAHFIVVVGLVTVGLGAMALGGIRLVNDHGSGSSTVGIALASASLLILVALARRKLRLAERVASGALRADGYLSIVGATQAAVTLAGVLTAAMGWRWADPAAAMTVGAVAVFIGLQAWRGDLRPLRVWSRRSLTAVAVGYVTAIAVVDGLLGARLILTGLLVVGPVLAAVSGRPRATVVVSAAAIALAVALGAPDEIWMTAEHAIWIGVVSIVAIITVVVLAIVKRCLEAEHAPGPGR
jgi:hypothetical protein